MARCSVYVLSWYKSTNTDADGASRALAISPRLAPPVERLSPYADMPGDRKDREEGHKITNKIHIYPKTLVSAHVLSLLALLVQKYKY
jgi:hypothetical protein